MDYKIVEKDQFTVIGVKRRIKSEVPYFTEVWNEFTENRNKDESGVVDDGFYGINEAPDENNLQDYLAGIAVANDYEISDSTFTKHVQPSSLYAVFECRVDTIGLTYTRIFSKQNDKRYKVNDKNISCFEYYPPNTVSSDDKVFLYIPVIETI